MLNGPLPDSRDVRDLPAILEDEDALKKFENDGTQPARKLLQEADPSIISNLYSAAEQSVDVPILLRSLRSFLHSG